MTTPARSRARAALELVQDEVRYVYVGLNGGNLTPVSAEETWERRYGDCKGKTALLLTLLDELGIEAEAVLVNSEGGDHVPEMLPSPYAFDHVLVRATIDGADYWMDGTIPGDATLLRRHPIMDYRAVLPLTAGESGLETRPVRIARAPSRFEITRVDASAGVDEPATVRTDYFLRGFEAHVMRIAFQMLSTGNVEEFLRGYFKGAEAWIDAEDFGWAWLAEDDVLRLWIEGEAELDWDDKTVGERELTLTGAGFHPPPKRERPSDQDQDAPWTNKAGRFTCVAVATHLPEPAEGYAWDHDTAAIMTEVGGVAYWRVADLGGREVRTIQSSRTMRHEVSPEDVAAANARIEDFDNSMSDVFETDAPADGHFLRTEWPAVRSIRDIAPENWREVEALCSPPPHEPETD
jgi:hypothetical protein